VVKTAARGVEPQDGTGSIEPVRGNVNIVECGRGDHPELIAAPWA